MRPSPLLFSEELPKDTSRSFKHLFRPNKNDTLLYSQLYPSACGLGIDMHVRLLDLSVAFDALVDALLVAGVIADVLVDTMKR